MTPNGEAHIINNYLKMAFPAPALIGGYMFLIFGLVGAFYGQPVGFLVTVLGGFVCFTFMGVQIDFTNKTIRQYTSYFGFKKGEIKNIETYPYVCIFKSNKTHKMYSKTNRSVSYSETSYDIFLLNKTHKEKILLKNESGKDKAIASAKEIAENLNIELVQYNPVVTSRINKR